ncbi:MAG TPA: crosslink repair DNA glycosylase YcaQ family protein [Actinomycetota bacterium]|nr:crosslink repair DNA glycosylase YcaQ family protein [Actinomycetota bacterium]
MRDPLELPRRRARQLAVMGQLLAAPRPASLLETVRGLGEVQLDPTAVVARTEHLVLWSRLGDRFRREELERSLWGDRELFEYWVHVVPTSDLPLHRISMGRYLRGDSARRTYVREWLDANAGFRRYVLRELRARGPLRARDLEDRTAVPWRTGGWNDGRGRHTAMLLDILWCRGEIMIVGRDGQQRLWDLASRSLPPAPPRPRPELARELVDRQLRARGLERVGRLGHLFDGPMPGRTVAIDRLAREGVLVPVRVEGLEGRWVAHGGLLDEPFRGRTTLLSPFDDLISDRDRTERLFDLRFRLEIYVPKAKREFGYFVLPILRGDRFVGRIDPAFDRAAGVLRIDAVHAEPDARPGDWPAARRAIDALARWLGADDVELPRVPAVWGSS